MQEQAWYYDLARAWDGSFGYQGNPPGAEEHGKHTSWDCTGLYLLAYALPRTPLAQPGLDDAPHLARQLLHRPGEALRCTLDAHLQRFAREALRSRLIELQGRNVADLSFTEMDVLWEQAKEQE